MADTDDGIDEAAAVHELDRRALEAGGRLARSLHTPTPPFERVRRRAARRRRVLVAAVAVVVAGAASVVVLGGEDPGDVVVAGPDDPQAPTTPWEPSFGAEVPAPPVPDGWKLLDIDDVRLAVPADWPVPASDWCERDARPADGLVLVATGQPAAPCPGLPGDPTYVNLVLDRAGPPATAAPGSIGTLDALVAPAGCVDCASQHFLPGGLTVAVGGPEAEAVLDTFTDAGRVRALQDGRVADTTGWGSVDLLGVTVDVPPGWEVDDLSDAVEIDPGTCGTPMFPPDETPRFSVGTSGIDVDCGLPSELSVATGDGAWLRFDYALPVGDTVARRTVNGLLVEAVRGGAEARWPGPPSLDLIVHGPDGEVGLSLGVGADAAIARAVVESVRSTSGALPLVGTTDPEEATGTSTTSPTSPDATSVDLELVSITPSEPRPGEVVEITVQADAEGLLDTFQADLGDGRRHEGFGGNGCGYGSGGDFAEPPPPPVGPTSGRLSFATTYSGPGTYEVVVEAHAHDSCADLDVPVGESSGSLAFSLTVADGPAPGNGDLPVYAHLTESNGWGGTDVQVVAQGEDPDGWVSRIRIDWGDGSEPLVVERTDPCLPGLGGWPADSAFSHTAQHTYPAPGEYVARLEVTSVACDGTRPQTARGENLVVYPSR